MLLFSSFCIKSQVDHSWVSSHIWCFRIKQHFQTLDIAPSTKFHPLKLSWTPSKLFWCEVTRQQWLKGWKLTIKLFQSATFYDCVHIKMRHVPPHYPCLCAAPSAPGDQCRCRTMDRERNGSRLTGRRFAKSCLWWQSETIVFCRNPFYKNIQYIN